MACNYFIKLPNGGEIKLSANLDILTDKKDKTAINLIQKDIKRYLDFKKIYTESSINDEKLNNLENLIITDIKKSYGFLNNDDIKSIINRDDVNVGNIIEILNKLVNGDEGMNNMKDFTSILKSTIFKEGDVEVFYKSKKKDSLFEKINLTTFYEKISKPIHTEYFNNIKGDGLLKIQTQNQVHAELLREINFNKHMNIEYSAINSLINILNNLTDKNTKFYNIYFNDQKDGEDAVVIKDGNTDMIFYNGDNVISLLNGVFKLGASKVNIDQLIPILVEYNNKLTEGSKNKINLEGLTSENFFKGDFEEDNFIEPQFNKIFKTNAYKEFLPRIIELVSVSNDLAEATQEKLKKSLTSLFSFINISKMNNKDSIEFRKYKEENEKNNKIYTDLTGKIYKKILEAKDFYFNRREVINKPSIAEIYEEIKANILLNRDMIKVETKLLKGERTQYTSFYIIPTKIAYGDNTVFVEGIKIDKNGDIIKATGYIVDNNLTFRKYQPTNEIINTKDAEMIPAEESINLLPKENELYLNRLIVTKAAKRGNYVKYIDNKGKERKGIIAFITPGKIVLNLTGKPGSLFNPELPIDTVTSMTIDKATFVNEFSEDSFTDANLEEKQDILKNEFEIINNKDKKTPSIVEGDIIIVKDKKGRSLYNEVIDSTINKVYILIKNNSGKYWIEEKDKSDAITVYRKKNSFNYEYNTAVDIANFKRDFIKSPSNISKYEYSILDNWSEIGDGDYLISKKSGEDIVYKVFNKKSNEVVRLTLNGSKGISHEYSNLGDFNSSDYILVTSRNISTVSSINIAEINNKKILINSTENLVGRDDVLILTDYTVYNDNENDNVLLPSGNYVGGHTKWGSQPLNSNEKSKLKELKIALKESNKKPEKIDDLSLYLEIIKGKDGNKEYHRRYNESLYKADLEKFPNNRQEKLNLLGKESFVRVKTLENQQNPTTFKVIEKMGDILKLEYSTFSKSGKIVSVFATIDLSKNSDDILDFWVRKGTDKQKKLEKLNKTDITTVEVKKERQLERIELINNVKKVFNEKVFGITIEDRNDKDRKDKKAWIETDTKTNETKIILNTATTKTTSTDVLHEYLHLFLIALKYNSPSDYEQLLTSKITQTKNQTMHNIEEIFIDLVINALKDDNLEKLDSFVDFSDLINKALKSLDINTNFIDGLSSLDILNKKMLEVFENLSGEVSKTDKGLIIFESSFRNWLDEQIKDNKLKIICK